MTVVFSGNYSDILFLFFFISLTGRLKCVNSLFTNIVIKSLFFILFVTFAIVNPLTEGTKLLHMYYDKTVKREQSKRSYCIFKANYSDRLSLLFFTSLTDRLDD